MLDAADNVLATSAVRSFVKDAAAPTIKAFPASGVPVVGPLSVTFNEPVKGVSAATFQVRVQGTSTVLPGQFTTSGATVSYTPTAPLVPGQFYTVQLTTGITDFAGNPFAGATNTTRAETTVQSSSPAVRHTWDLDNGATAVRNVITSDTAGASASYTFTGTSVAVDGPRARDGGRADVYVDGVRRPTQIDAYAAVSTVGQALFTLAGLTSAQHTLRVCVTGTKQAASVGTRVWIDDVRVGATTVQETSLRVAFAEVAAASAAGASFSTERFTSTGDTGSKPEYRLSVRGTAVTITGTKGANGGQAQVWVDGVLKVTVDCFVKAPAYNATTASVTGLSDQAHDVRVVLTGGKQAASTGTAVMLEGTLQDGLIPRGAAGAPFVGACASGSSASMRSVAAPSSCLTTAV